MFKSTTLICAGALALVLAGCSKACPNTEDKRAPLTITNDWQTLDTIAYKGKRDDISFATPSHGWYGTGKGDLYATADGGTNWQLVSSHPGTFIRALGFIDENTGYIGNVGTDYYPGVEDETPLYRTDDGGQSWESVYRSGRSAELVWKASFPDGLNGYATVQSYDLKRSTQLIVKTVDGGKTWAEIPLTENAKARQFGIGFVDKDRGWVGTMAGGFYTSNGGASFEAAPIARAANKFRIIPTENGAAVYAIGTEIQKLELSIQADD